MRAALFVAVSVTPVTFQVDGLDEAFGTHSSLVRSFDRGAELETAGALSLFPLDKPSGYAGWHVARPLVGRGQGRCPHTCP